MRRRHKLITLFTMAILSGSLAGCGGSSGCEGFIECNGPIEEAVVEADYFVLNQRAEAACISAQELFTNSDVMLMTTQIPSGMEAKIYHAWEGTGGHAFPSNFFSAFKAVNCVDSTNIYYEGVVDKDWQQLPNSKLLLTLAPPP